MHWQVMYSVPSTVWHWVLGSLEQCSAFMHSPSTVDVRTIGSLHEQVRKDQSPNLNSESHNLNLMKNVS